MNDIANITVMTAKPMFFDSYKKNRSTGSVILIDEGTNETVAAGMINFSKKYFFLFASLRIFRFVIYGYAIYSALS